MLLLSLTRQDTATVHHTLLTHHKRMKPCLPTPTDITKAPDMDIRRIRH
jgi:hypothetical protein